MESDLFGDTVFADLGDDSFGKTGVHITGGPFHLRFWAEDAVEITNICEFYMNPFKGDFDMTEGSSVHLSPSIL